MKAVQAYPYHGLDGLTLVPPFPTLANLDRPPVIDRSFPLAEIVDAFRLQESGGHFGKIVVEY